jgi:hypothetical protein
MPLTHLSRSIIDKSFKPEICARLRQIFFCGSYGDPIMHPDFIDILRDFRQKNPQLWLYIHTNGGVHDQHYWQEIADIIDGFGQIDFGIDGLNDTLSLYRRNVQFEQVMQNAAAFIERGGRAQWNFIVFKHNEHQIDAAKKLSEDMHFHGFLARRTGRFFHHQQEIELSEWPVHDKNKQIIYWLQPPQSQEWRNRSTKRLPALRRKYGDLKDYFSQTKIQCDALSGKKVAINCQGLVLPCNFFNHNLFDMRFHEQALPGRNDLHDINGKNQVRQFLESHGLENLDIHHKSLDEIFQCSMWDELIKSWDKEIGAGRLFECAMTCGQEFTKVWDQGGNVR